MPPELAERIPSAVIIAVMLYLHRTLRQDVKDLRDRIGRIEERMARLKGRSTCCGSSSSATDAAPPHKCSAGQKERGGRVHGAA